MLAHGRGRVLEIRVALRANCTTRAGGYQAQRTSVPT